MTHLVTHMHARTHTHAHTHTHTHITPTLHLTPSPTHPSHSLPLILSVPHISSHSLPLTLSPSHSPLTPSHPPNNFGRCENPQPGTYCRSGRPLNSKDPETKTICSPRRVWLPQQKMGVAPQNEGRDSPDRPVLAQSNTHMQWTSTLDCYLT